MPVSGQTAYPVPSSGGGGGGGAPTDAQYLTLAVDAGLTDERRFVPGAGLTATDGGAGGDYTLVVSGTTGVTSVTSTPYAVLASDQLLVVKPSASNITVNLPAGGAGVTYTVKHGNDSSYDVSVVPNGLDTIDGQGAYLLTTRQALSISYESGVWHSR